MIIKHKKPISFRSNKGGNRDFFLLGISLNNQFSKKYLNRAK